MKVGFISKYDPDVENTSQTEIMKEVPAQDPNDSPYSLDVVIDPALSEEEIQNQIRHNAVFPTTEIFRNGYLDVFNVFGCHVENRPLATAG